MSSPRELSPAEKRHQLDLLAQHEEAGNVLPETAARYRADVERGIPILGRPMDGPNAAKTAKRWKKVERGLRADAAVAARRARSITPVIRSGRASARAPRRPNVRRSGAKARAPDDSEPPLPDLGPGLRIISRAAFRRELVRAGL